MSTKRQDVIEEMRAYERAHRLQSRDGFRPDHLEEADRIGRWTDALERCGRGAKTLGEMVDRHIEDTLRWAGMEEQIGTDDPDQQLAWERCAEMPGRIAALEAELASLRGGRDA